MIAKSLVSICLFFTIQTSPSIENNQQNNTLESKVLNAIMMEDYMFLEEVIKEEIIDPNLFINGKPILSYACIYNKPEMVQLLYIYGAHLDLQCEAGYTPEEHAKKNNAINALAEIIVIKA